jgi:hypothetical protein
MYYLIRKNQQQIIADIHPTKDVQEYERLLQEVRLRQVTSSQFQRRYKNFWRMNTAQLGPSFYQSYFPALDRTKPLPTLRRLCQTLYPHSKRRGGQQTLQFSFPTKLRHMRKPKLPIYDRYIARFFLFQEPATTIPYGYRINGYLAFHNFLVKEYARIITTGQLRSAMNAFRQQFNPQKHTEQKIIDWLIWKFVELADKGQIKW